MKIAIFSDTFLPQVNGVTKTLGKMKEYMDEKGIEYRFIVPKPKELKKPYSNTIAIQSIDFFLYPECQLSLPRTLYVKQMLDEFKPDLIHLVTPFTLGLIGLNYAKRNHIPIFASYHTDFPKYLKHYKLDFLQGVCWKFFAKFHENALMNFCPSEHTKKQMEENGIKDVKIWGRGINTSLYSPKKFDQQLRDKYAKADEKILLYVGRIAPEKEIEVAIKAVNKLNKKGLKLKLVIIGDGPQQAELEKKAAKNVIFAGYQRGEALARHYAMADVFAFPSSSETYGNVILEAMASGLPVVAPLEGGIKENLINDYNGLAFEAGNAKDMSAKIIELLSNQNKLDTLSKQAREYTTDKTWEAIYNRLFEQYKSAIKNSKHTDQQSA